MMLADKQIRRLLRFQKIADWKTAIYNGSYGSVKNVGYDLRAAAIWKNGESVEECTLCCGESVLIASGEIVQFGDKCVGKVYLRNRLIRAGLTMDAPLYQPGHTTRIFYRLTNLSGAPIQIEVADKHAMLTFEKLRSKPRHRYNGKYQNEIAIPARK